MQSVTDSIASMRGLGWHWRSLAVVVLVTPSWPAFAAGLDCNRARDPVEKTICASPELSELDTALSNTYAKAIAQDRTRKAALQRDQQNWLGERDDLAWRLLNDPETASAAVKELWRLYRERSAFLNGLGDLRPVSDSPLAEKAAGRRTCAAAGYHGCVAGVAVARVGHPAATTYLRQPGQAHRGIASAT